MPFKTQFVSQPNDADVAPWWAPSAIVAVALLLFAFLPLHGMLAFLVVVAPGMAIGYFVRRHYFWLKLRVRGIPAVMMPYEAGLCTKSEAGTHVTTETIERQFCLLCGTPLGRQNKG